MRAALRSGSTGAPLRLVLAVAAGLVPTGTLVLGAVFGSGFGNDFSSYWLAGRLVAEGRNPYDLTALASLARREHVEFLLGSGYSYPPPFAVLMAPLAHVPFAVALLLFQAVSIAVFAFAVAAWAREVARNRDTRAALGLSIAAGLYPPTIGSVYFGQANLLVFGLLALSLRSIIPPAMSSAARGDEAWADEAWGHTWASPSRRLDMGLGLGVGLAGVVKLVPLVIMVPLIQWRRWTAVAALAAAVVASIALAALLAPAATSGTSQLSSLLSTDGFWSNQSLNGFATRLVSPTERTSPLLPGLVDPAVLGAVLTAGLAAATVVVLWRISRSSVDAPPSVGTLPAVDRLPSAATRRAEPSFRGSMRWSRLSLAVALALVAGIAGAPKDSFWNHLPALLAAGLLIASLVPRTRGPAVRERQVAALLVTWYAAAWLQMLLDATQGAATRAMGPAGGLFSSTALVGLLALWVAIAIGIRGFR